MIGFEDFLQILFDRIDFYHTKAFKPMIQMQGRQVQKRIFFQSNFGSENARLFAQSTKLKNIFGAKF